MADDRQLREMTCDPRFRKVLVTTARPRSVRPWCAPSLTRRGFGVGGLCRTWKKVPGLAALEALPQVATLLSTSPIGIRAANRR